MKVVPPYEIRLAHPIPVNKGQGEPISVVTITRRPRLKDLRAIAAHTNKIAQNAAAIERITDLAKMAIDELDVDDFQTIAELVVPLFSRDDETPDESSGDAPDGP